MDNQLYYDQADIELRRFISKVYGWMFIALSVTGFTAIYTVSSEPLLEFIFSNMMVFYGLVIGEFVLVGYLVVAVRKMTAQKATITFIAYSVLNGLTLSVIFLIYTAQSIASTFFITAVTFGVMSAYGYFTKTDLTSIRNFLFMGLIGFIIASVVNIFLQSEMIYWVTTYAGILIFVGLTAYDTQKIKKMYVFGNEGTDEEKKEAIMGALALYLDFINLFLLLLRVTGQRR